MASTTVTKVTSVGSHSGLPTAPNPTPATEALDDAVIEPPPPMDFAAVTRILAPITETLNESAHEAMYPSPPINTPVVGSPTHSVNYRFPVRGRGFSVIGDRLAHLKLDDRKLHRHRLDHDVSSSNRCSNAEDCGDCECDVASASEVLGDDCKDKNCPDHESTSMSPQPPLTSPLGEGSVPIALGSPSVNPYIEEFLSFSSKDLPNQAPAPTKGTTLAQHASSTSTTALDVNSLRSHASFLSDGVTEKSNWAEDVEDGADHICLRLEQLAMDENAADPSKSINEYYIDRLKRILGSNKRMIPVDIDDLILGTQKM